MYLLTYISSCTYLIVVPSFVLPSSLVLLFVNDHINTVQSTDNINDTIMIIVRNIDTHTKYNE